MQVLKWVKENIAAFGVTNVDHSFGSAAVYHTINSPLVKGLIKGAICESGIKSPYDPTMPGFANSYMNQSYAYTFSETYASSLNAFTVAELRNLSTDVLGTGTGVEAFSGFQPILDGYAIPSTYYESLQHAPVNNVPVLAGNNKDEDGASLSTNNVSLSTYLSDTNSTYGPYASQSLAAYNSSRIEYSINARARHIASVSTWQFANYWNVHSN